MVAMPVTIETIERTDGSLALVEGSYLDATYGQDSYDELVVCAPGGTCSWISAEEHT